MITIPQKIITVLAVSLVTFTASAQDKDVAKEGKLTSTEVLASSQAKDWRQPEQRSLMYVQLANIDTPVVFELAEDFAPKHIANLRTLVKQKYFDGLAVIRSQDNYVAQWGDPAEDESKFRSLGDAAETVEPEFYRAKKGLALQNIVSRDAYADEVGFVKGFAVGADAKGSKNAQARAWLTHCYGALGVARGMAMNSGNASGLYAITGHSPRHLDRNITLLGRALVGMENLSTLPRGTESLGFYKTAEEATPIISVRFGDELPAEEQIHLEVMRTDTKIFRDYVLSRTQRVHEWFADPVNRIEVCNVNVPSRPASTDSE
ncbi:MAG: peptidylprolyl isomerase [Arenicella sp.]|jgi:cyclophilin family peptidyl-prolyl cis-trans isomerase|nr:peptidylprolyl isomerase [Arenicella sp.]